MPIAAVLVPKKHPRAFAYALLVLTLLCWGVAFPILKPMMEITGAFRFLFYRFALATLLTLPFLIQYLVDHKKLWKEIPRIMAIETIGTVIALGLLYLGLAKTSAIEAGLLSTTSPVFVVIAGVVLLKEREEKHEAIGMSIAFVATILLTLLPFFGEKSSLTSLSLTGNFLILAYCVCTALASALAKRHYQILPKFFVAIISFWTGLIFFSIIAFIEKPIGTPMLTTIYQDWQHPVVWIGVIYGAIIASIIAVTASFKAMEYIEISEASLFSYLQPLVYIPLGYILLGETISPLQLVSLSFILLGVFIAEERWKKRPRQKRHSRKGMV